MSINIKKEDLSIATGRHKTSLTWRELDKYNRTIMSFHRHSQFDADISKLQNSYDTSVETDRDHSAFVKL